MRLFIKIALIAIGIATITCCETKKPTDNDTANSLVKEKLSPTDSLAATIPRDTLETDVEDTMPVDMPTESIDMPTGAGKIK